MNNMVIGVDVDGILADFNKGYKALIESETMVRLPDIDDYYPNTWYYDAAAGLHKDQIKKLWKMIADNPSFWRELPAYEGAAENIERLAILEADIYFITSRVGKTCKWQTERWLEEELGFIEPTVLISSDKAGCCKALKANYYIDDKVENCLDVQAGSPATHLFMLKRPWNWQMSNIPMLRKLEDFVSIVEENVQNG